MKSPYTRELSGQILRWSTYAHKGGAAKAQEGGFEDNPASRELIEQVRFTRRFLPTYLIVLGVVVLLFGAARWCMKFSRRCTNQDYCQKHNLDISPASSSSSSTLQGTPISKTPASSSLEATETTRLLSPESGILQAHTSVFTRVSCYITSTLLYQPSSIRALTSSTNLLPQNSTTLLVLLFLSLNIFYLIYHTPLSIPMLFVFADRAGLLFAVNLPVLYILAAKTNQPLKLLTGWSYEGLNIFHRRLGEWMIALGVVHSTGMFGVWYTLLRPLHFSLERFLSTKLVLLGVFALIGYVALWVTSTGYFRRLWYETFLSLHIFLQVVALFLLFLHHPGSRVYVSVSVGIWTLDRIVGRMVLGRQKLVATLQIAEDCETVLLYCEVDIRPGILGSSVNILNGWKAGQHVFVTVPGIGWQHYLQSHPFTIASPAPPSEYTGVWSLQLTIRAQQGFSKQLFEYAKLHQHTEVILDGPYGSVDILEALRKADRQCLIAGGSGIAVTYPLAWSLLVRDDASALVSTRTIYRNGQKHVPCLRNGCLPSALFDGQVMHLWINQHSNHQSWLTMIPREDALRSNPIYGEPGTDECKIWPENTIKVASMTTATYSTRDPPRGQLEGRPDVALELRCWTESGRRKGSDNRICVVVSGPDGLVRDVRNAAAKLLLEGWNIEVFVEKFGW